MQWLARAFAGAFVRRLAVALAAVVLAGIAQCAHAAGTVPQLPGQLVVGWCLTAGPGATSLTACQENHALLATDMFADYVARQPRDGDCSPANCPAVNTLTLTQAVCSADGCSVPVAYYFIPANAVVGNSLSYQRVSYNASPTCPANSFGPNGSGLCTCDGGFQPDAAGTACVPPPDACVPTLAKPLGAAGQEFQYPVAAKVVPTRVCSGGCGYIPTGAAGSGAALWTKLGTTYTYVARSAADWIGDGVSCTPAPVGSPGTPPETPPQPDPTPPPPGQCKGTVNGVEVVVPCDGTSSSSGTSGAGSGSSGSTTGAGNGGPAGSSTTGSETTCTGSSCTTTTTTTTQNGDGTSTTTTETKNEEKGDYCAEHPGSPQCTPSDECDDHPERLGCMEAGTLEAVPIDRSTVSVAGITPQTGWGPSNASCPAPQTVTIQGKTYSFEWTYLCDLAVGVRPLFLAFAWLFAAFVFVGIGRKGS